MSQILVDSFEDITDNYQSPQLDREEKEKAQRGNGRTAMRKI